MPKITHNATKTPTYKSWKSMRDRCNNPNDPSYPRYGGRGIFVCAAWNASFEAFVSDVGWRPSMHHTIDRIDNDGAYEPSNCRWATKKEQSRNTRAVRLITHNGQTKTVADWADHLGIPHGTIRNRLNAGWEVKDVLGLPHGLRPIKGKPIGRPTQSYRKNTDAPQ